MKQYIKWVTLLGMFLVLACSREQGPLIVDDSGVTKDHLADVRTGDTLDYQYGAASFDTSFNHNGQEIEIHLTRQLSEDSTRVFQTLLRDGDPVHARCFENRIDLELLHSSESPFTQQIRKRDLLPAIRPWLDEAHAQFFLEQAILVNVRFQKSEGSGGYLFTSSFQISGTLLPDLISLRVYPDCCTTLVPRKQAARLIHERFEQSRQVHATP